MAEKPLPATGGENPPGPGEDGYQELFSELSAGTRGAPTPEIVEGEIVRDEDTKAAGEIVRRQGDMYLSPIAITATGIGLLPVEKQAPALAEYDKRRTFLRKWLLSHFVEGIHYGFPFEQKTDENGNLQQWKKGRGNAPGKYVTIPKNQWQAKPSLYKAGALLVLDLLQIEKRFEPDAEYWRMLGSPDGTLVTICTLWNRATGKRIGEGRGVFAKGEKGMNENSCLKMSKKRAMVDAVLDTFAIAGELFTQDLEDMPGQEPRPAPQRNPQASSPPSRDARGGGTVGDVPVAHDDAHALWDEFRRLATAVWGTGASQEYVTAKWYDFMHAVIGKRVAMPKLTADEIVKMRDELEESGPVARSDKLAPEDSTQAGAEGGAE